MPLREKLLIAEATNLPSHLLEVVKNAPANVDRRAGAKLVTDYLFPVSYRTLEAWPLPTQFVNGRAIVPTIKLIELAYEKLTAAPIVMGGRRAPSDQAA
jgi:hypothetical protein